LESEREVRAGDFELENRVVWVKFILMEWPHQDIGFGARFSGYSRFG